MDCPFQRVCQKYVSSSFSSGAESLNFRGSEIVRYFISFLYSITVFSFAVNCGLQVDLAYKSTSRFLVQTSGLDQYLL